MNASPAASPTTSGPPVRPRRRWLRAVLLFIALAILGPAVTILVMMKSARNAWDAAEAEADQLDPRWRLADIVADQPANQLGPGLEEDGLAVLEFLAFWQGLE